MQKVHYLLLLYTIDYLKNIGYNVIAVSGAITSSPLYMREFEENSTIPIISSASDNMRLNYFKGLLIKNKTGVIKNSSNG